MSGGFRSRSESARHGTNSRQAEEKPAGSGRGQRRSGTGGAGSGGSGTGGSSFGRGAGTAKDHRKYRESGQSGGNRARGRRGNNRPRQNRGDTGRRGIRDLPRHVALELLLQVENDGAFGNIALSSLLASYELHGRDAAFATELGYGTLRAQGLLDAVIAECSSRALDDIDATTLAVLRLGTYQLLRTRVGAHAAVNTSVDLCEEFGKGGAKGFVNAVLRSVSAHTENEWIATITRGMDPIDRVALATAHPRWIAEAFQEALGPARGELTDALIADDERPLVHLVARPGEITAEELALICGGEQTQYSPYGVILPEGDPAKLQAVREGMAAVQDEGSQLIARAVVEAPLEGDDQGRWLDLCAGPGGKAALMGSLAALDGARVDAIEPASHRAELVKSTCRGLPVDVHVADGRDCGLEPGFDRILVDAPCSGLGALRRRPEARWRKSPADIPSLTQLQKELLAAAASLARSGGVVCYSTCSPHLQETLEIVSWAEENCPLEPLDTPALMCGMPNCRTGKNAVQMWPHRHGTDAMFVQVFRKK